MDETREETKSKQKVTHKGRPRKIPQLPREIWEKVAGLVSEDDLLAFALTCKEFRELQLALTPHTKMKVDQFSVHFHCDWEVTRGWILWVFDLLIELPCVCLLIFMLPEAPEPVFDEL